MNFMISYLLCTEFKKCEFNQITNMCEMIEDIQAAQLAMTRARKQGIKAQSEAERPQEAIAQ